MHRVWKTNLFSDRKHKAAANYGVTTPRSRICIRPKKRSCRNKLGIQDNFIGIEMNMGVF
jgi:hypothetical protein